MAYCGGKLVLRKKTWVNSVVCWNVAEREFKRKMIYRAYIESGVYI